MGNAMSDIVNLDHDNTPPFRKTTLCQTKSSQGGQASGYIRTNRELGNDLLSCFMADKFGNDPLGYIWKTRELGNDLRGSI